MAQQNMPNGIPPRQCIHCGSFFTDDYGFCPSCGAYYNSPKKAVSDSGNGANTERQAAQPHPDQQQIEAYQRNLQALRQRMLESNRSAAIMMISVWVGISLISALLLLTGDATAIDYLARVFGFGKDAMFEASVLSVSGVLAVITVFCCYRRKYWSVAWAACLLSAAETLFLGVLGERMCIWFFLFGMIAVLRVRNIRPLFS